MGAKRMLAVLVVAGLVGLSGRAEAAGPRPYIAFLRDVVDLQALARRPAAGETCRQFSSYDRASRIGENGQKLDWGANGDAGNFLREDPEGHVLAEMEGPGAVVRIWSANPRGTLKVYIDGAVQPTFQADFAQLTRGDFPGMPVPIVGIHSMGANCYLPMPYQTRCKVVVADPGSLYYSVDYRTFPAGTQVEPFHWPLTALEQQAVMQLADRLAHPEQAPSYPGARRQRGQQELAPGATASLVELSGPGAITALRMKVELPTDLVAGRKALRGLLLTGSFDEAPNPQVWAPLGDFFGTGPGLNLFRGLPTGCTEEGCYSHWYMPYERSARLTVLNDGPAPVRLSWEVEHAPRADSFASWMHFHAKWRREYPNRTFDWPFLEASGQGRYVGVALAVWNPSRGWWGEGDEKVWVDGESFPSWFGTGSEDYFGYAWCSPQVFSHAMHAQPLCEGPGNANYTSVNRWHVADNIPYQRSFLVTIENYGQDKDYACVSYWYAAPGGSDFFQPDPAESRLAYHEPLPPFKLAGAIEGETLQIVGREFTGEVGPQDMGGFGGSWSDESHLWLRPAGPGNWIELAVPVAEAGEYQVLAYLTKAIDYGIVQLSVNGVKAGEPFDGFHDGVVPSGAVDLGRHQLAAGQAILRLEVAGKHEQATGYMAGLDCVVLKK